MNESSGLFSILKGLNLNKILNTAGKTINFVNKAIPMYKEIKPTIGNVRNIFSGKKDESQEVIDEIKVTRPIKKKKIISTSNRSNNLHNDTLTFFQ